MYLRLAKKSDIGDITRVIKKSFSKQDTKFSRKEVAEMFSTSLNKPTYVVAIENNEIIGLAGFILSWFSFDIYEIFWVAVRPDFQGKGAGRELVKNVIRRIKSFKGQYKASGIILSTSSPQFFERCGFEKILVLPKKSFLMVMKL